jgi:hypothetical protein
MLANIGYQWTRAKQISCEFRVTNHAHPERLVAGHRYLRRFLYDVPFDSQAKDTTQHTQLPVDGADGAHRTTVSVGLGNVLPATTKTALPNANRTDGHTHLLICDNRTMDKTMGMKVTAASISRLQLS